MATDKTPKATKPMEARKSQLVSLDLADQIQKLVDNAVAEWPGLDGVYLMNALDQVRNETLMRSFREPLKRCEAIVKEMKEMVGDEDDDDGDKEADA